MSWLEKKIEYNNKKRSIKSGIPWLVAGVIIALIIIVLLTILIPYSESKGVSVIRIEGTIETGDFYSGGYVGSEYVGSRIRQAADDPLVEAIVLRVDSPGGSPAGAQEIIEDVQYAKTKKPVFVSMGDMATSAAYYISAYADKIYASPDTLTGSIGTIWTFIDTSRSLQIEGVNVSIVKSGDMKDLTSQYRGLTDEEQEYVQAMVDESFERFLDDVLSQRNISREDVEEAQLYRGEDAYDLGLIDEFGNLFETMEAAKNYERPVAIIEMEVNETTGNETAMTTENGTEIAG
ncbi:signal peptide peptidase SppA, 36K type [Methanolacinia petrolearia DSM 11571]|uniref:Signal peptide peptidase SppA, 36K type n=1 Tax=Methanolacinia petrolearia (strain DSM 11571 / OCM 486 / SEBR 4847) TaxID=679926 RepID=E1RIW6_METP4|nr:signal peptide peptidase SppA [Methanolacinia petrolearia]ADN35554.1 signal peptide peptidase SppA, 36K type [Methanolacinia petrolearia DSM 11571]